MLRAHRSQKRSVLLGAMFYCAFAALAPSLAEAAGRRAPHAVRRTASAPAGDAVEGARTGRAADTAARPSLRGARVESARSRTKDDPSSRAAASAVKQDDDRAKSSAPLADDRAPSRSDRAAAKGSAEAKLVAKSIDGKSPPDAKLPSDAARTAGEGAARVADGRISPELRAVTKTPTDLPAAQKSAAEKFAGEATSGEMGDAVRTGADPGANVRGGASVLAGAASATSATAAGTSRPAVVTLEGPVFDSGEVPRAAASLERMKNAFARCAAAENALTKGEGTVDLRFLVRAPGRAEGVGADKARGLSADVVRCMTTVLARSYIGAPSDDPVGVGVTVRVRKD